MRKYYKQRFIANARGNLTNDSDIVWGLLESMVNGLGTATPPDFLALARDAILLRDVTRLTKGLSELLFSYPQLHDKSFAPVFRDMYQIVCFLKKFPFTLAEHPSDRRATAMQKLNDCEVLCKSTNERLRGVSFLPSWVHRARSIISDVLGDLTPSLVMEMICEGSHGPGATLSNKGSKTTPYYKYAVLPYTCTKTALPYAYAAISSNSRWMEILERSGSRREIPPLIGPQYIREVYLLDACVKVVEEDSITFVPKDAFTDRPIAVGASLNIFLQLGVKAYMQERLRKFGVDLTDQTRNQRLAQEGSLYYGNCFFQNPNQFVTLDLASASDTLSIECVKLLLPRLWWAFLDDLRHKTGRVDSKVISYEKFCAMGNGFTFPLESLIFFAVAKAISEEGGLVDLSHVSIYGDDIICRKRVCAQVIAGLKFLGFDVNSSKSFTEGPFKESCGHDYLHGINIRPFYLKRRLKTYADIYFLCNSVARMCMSGRGSPVLRALYHRALSQIPRDCRIFVPLGDTTDNGLIVPLSFMMSRALRPYLSKQECFSLYQSGFLADLHEQNLPLAWRIAQRPIDYNGRSDVRLLTALESLDGRGARHFLDGSLVSVGGTVNRRKAVRCAVDIRPVPNWDWPYASAYYLNPIFWAE